MVENEVRSNEIMIFEGHEVEVFEYDGRVLFNPYHVGNCLDIDNVTVRRHIQSMNKNQVIKLKNSNVQDMNFRKLHNTGENFLTESGVFKLIFKSQKPEAEKFQDWVTDEVLPSIRKHGAYMTPQKIEEVLLNPDTIIQLATTLKNEQEKNKKLQLEIAHKQEVITGLTDDIDVYKKKDIINRICRYNYNNYANRYKELYKCFRENEHVDLEARCEGYNLKQTKKKDRLTTIKYAEKFGFIDSLYTYCVKLYETEVKEIIQQLNKIQD